MKRAMKKIMTGLLAAVLISGCTAGEAWEKHEKAAQKAITAGNYTEALTELDAAIELNPENPDLYLSRGYCQLHRRKESIGGILLNPLENYELAISDFQQALDLDPDNEELQEKVLAAYNDANVWADVVNDVYPDSLQIEEGRGADSLMSLAAENAPEGSVIRRPCEPLDPISYSYAYEVEIVSAVCRVFDENDRKIYQDFYNSGRANAGKNICRSYFFYDDAGKLIREEYKWDSNAEYYALVGNKPDVKEYAYDANGILQTVTFISPLGRVNRVDYYDGKGVLMYSDTISNNGEHVITENEHYKKREDMADWETLYDDILISMEQDDYQHALALSEKGMEQYPEQGEFHVIRAQNRFLACLDTEGNIRTEMMDIYPELTADLDRAAALGTDAEEVDYVREQIDSFYKIVLEHPDLSK